jgi:hypothetical protein
LAEIFAVFRRINQQGLQIPTNTGKGTISTAGFVDFAKK